MNLLLGSRKKVVLFAGVVALVIIAVSLTWILASRHTASPGNKDLKSVEAKVGKLYLLPTNEQPTLATVTDKAKLQDKFLEAKAQTGDRILIYTQNKLVIIYRPSINKIAAVGILSVDPALPEAQGATLTVLDSTNNPAREQTIVNKIKTAYPAIKVTDGGKADVSNLPNTIVIDNTSNFQKSDLQVALESVIPAKEGVVPLGQNAVSSDMLVIIGTDKQ